MRISLPAMLAVVIVSTFLSATLVHLLNSPASAARLQDDSREDGLIAYCAIMEISQELMNSERFRPEREAEEQRLFESLREIREEITEISTQLRDAERDDPAFADERQRIQELMTEFQQKQGIAQRQMEQFIVSQFSEAYEMTRSSARAVADDLGFEYLLSSGSPDDPVPTDRPMDAIRNEMFQRTVLMAPEGADISDDVREDLNLF